MSIREERTFWDFLAGSDRGSIPGSGRSPAGGPGNPLQSSCLENPTDRGACRAAVHGVVKGQTTEQLTRSWDFPGDPEVKNQLAKAGNRRSIPGLVRELRSRMPQGSHTANYKNRFSLRKRKSFLTLTLEQHRSRQAQKWLEVFVLLLAFSC